MSVIGTEWSRKPEERRDLQPGSILVIFELVEVDLGER